MKITNKIRKFFKGSDIKTFNARRNTGSSYQKLSTPLGEIEEGDLTKPYINTNLDDSQFIRFGWDNLYPSLIDQMYYQSALHSSIIQFQIQAAIGGGYEFEDVKGSDVVNVRYIERHFGLRQLVKGFAIDLKMHNRCHLLVKRDGGKITSMKRLRPTDVRYNKSLTKFWVSDNWQGFNNAKAYYSFDKAEQDGYSVISYIDLALSPGNTVYPIPKEASAFNWCYLDGETSNLQKKNIQKAIFGNLVIKIPTEFETDEDFQTFKNNITNSEGEVLSALILTAEGEENLPSVESYPVSQVDEAFKVLEDRIDNKICQAHSINPLIMGIAVSNALNSGSDIKESYNVWDLNVVRPYRNSLEDFINNILGIMDISATFKFNEFQIVKDVIVEDDEIEIVKESI